MFLDRTVFPEFPQVEHTESHETEVQARQAEIVVREQENDRLQSKNKELIEQLVSPSISVCVRSSFLFVHEGRQSKGSRRDQREESSAAEPSRSDQSPFG